MNAGGITVSGRIDQGSVNVGTKYLIMPGDTVCVVKGVESLGQLTKRAVAGDQVRLTLQGLEINQVGQVLVTGWQCVSFSLEQAMSCVQWTVQFQYLPDLKLKL